MHACLCILHDMYSQPQWKLQNYRIRKPKITFFKLPASTNGNSWTWRMIKGQCPATFHDLIRLLIGSGRVVSGCWTGVNWPAVVQIGADSVGSVASHRKHTINWLLLANAVTVSQNLLKAPTSCMHWSKLCSLAEIEEEETHCLSDIWRVTDQACEVSRHPKQQNRKTPTAPRYISCMAA